MAALTELPDDFTVYRAVKTFLRVRHTSRDSPAFFVPTAGRFGTFPTPLRRFAMTHDAVTLLMLVVITHAPLIYGAVFCPSETPMRRLIAWTEAVAQIVLAVIEWLRRK
jgi:hypothetical protein